MTTSDTTKKHPLWLLIEECILGLESQAPAGADLEAAIQQMAGELDKTGYNVSRHGGNMLELRWAVGDMIAVGRPMMADFNAAIQALTLDDVSDAYAATSRVLDDLAKTWPKLSRPERRPDVIRIIQKARLDLLIANAKALSGDQGIRYLIEQEVASAVIISALEITDEKLKAVNAQIEAERAERARVAALLEKVSDKSSAEKVKHLLENDVTEALIVEMAAVGQGDIDAAKKAMEEELKEKQRLAEEEAARKKAEAEGPALDAIPPDQRLEYIESIREIMEFSDQEKEIRTMCEQSSIPKCLVDIAVSEPAKLDALEKEAQG